VIEETGNPYRGAGEKGRDAGQERGPADWNRGRELTPPAVGQHRRHHGGQEGD